MFHEGSSRVGTTNPFLPHRSQSVPSTGTSIAGGGSNASSLNSSITTGDDQSGQFQVVDTSFQQVVQEEDKILRKTLFYLVSTLNAAFYPDYDFGNSTSREFSKEHSLQVCDI